MLASPANGVGTHRPSHSEEGAATGFMRVLVLVLLWSTVLAGEASASSFVTLAPPADAATPSFAVLETPSIKTIGLPKAPLSASGTALSYPYPAEPLPHVAHGAPPGEVALSPSVVAMGEPAISFDKVAAISDKTRTRQSLSLPMVIRGGVVGDAFSRAEPPAPQTLPTDADAGGSGGSGSTQTEASAGGGSKPPEPKSPPEQPAPPPPAAAPPPAATTPPTRAPE